MPLPVGIVTPWAEADDQSLADPGRTVVYFKPGDSPGPAEFLAEQLRADGVIRSLGPALTAAASSQPLLGWHGENENGDDVVCDAAGWSRTGTLVAVPLPCVIAIVDITER